MKTKENQNLKASVDEFYWQVVRKIGIGQRYLYPDPEKMIVRDAIENYCRSKFKKGLFMAGPVGTGKTSILAYIAFQIVKDCGIQHPVGCDDPAYWQSSAGEYLAFISSPQLFNLFFKTDQKDYEKRFNHLGMSPVLMIDDFGAEYQSDYPLARFQELIGIRYDNELTTIVTSNLSPKQLTANRKLERIVDRFRDPRWMELISINGKSMRR